MIENRDAMSLKRFGKTLSLQEKDTSEHGASLVEISITVLIIAITAVVIATFSRNTLNMSQDARSMDAAHLAGEQKLVELGAETFPAASGTDTAFVDSIRCIRSWAIKDTMFIRRGIITVVWKTPRGSRQIKLTGAMP